MPQELNKKKFRYLVLKSLDDGKQSRLNNIGIDLDRRDQLLMEMQQEGLIRGLTSTKDRAVGRPEITLRGEEYLNDNSKLKTAYDTAKEIRDWIPFLYR
ncbi:YjcQ family protein [Oceanobacillus jeddahense]|uniref:YjcQ family protein n=1 Tax=Oceanobacillus jeddahense TaxID=1462527 RepID=UPI000694CA34|nr:YjcQ family protein [Oceanobacillus jeddahense]